MIQRLPNADVRNRAFDREKGNRCGFNLVKLQSNKNQAMISFC
jgi:hypothetical protein